MAGDGSNCFHNMAKWSDVCCLGKRETIAYFVFHNGNGTRANGVIFWFTEIWFDQVFFFSENVWNRWYTEMKWTHECLHFMTLYSLKYLWNFLLFSKFFKGCFLIFLTWFNTVTLYYFYKLASTAEMEELQLQRRYLRRSSMCPQVSAEEAAIMRVLNYHVCTLELYWLHQEIPWNKKQTFIWLAEFKDICWILLN